MIHPATMKVHFIAIGGSAMHNLAIALKKKGYHVTGSDDEIFDPSRRRLLQHELLPMSMGWDPGRIHKGLDAVILGMHARADNPELARARELGLKIYSYPEFLYEQSKNKTRVVIGGSHGKTTITAMILHVLKHHGIHTDFMVGAQIQGFDVMVQLSENAPYMIMEGDEYLSSPIDPRPKFHIYRPHIALLSGIAWDHINVFPTFEIYLEQFRQFIHLIENNGKLIYCREEQILVDLVQQEANESLCLYPYKLPAHEIRKGQSLVISGDNKYPVGVFGRHNLMNMEGARLVCQQLGVSNDMFFDAIKSFSGAGNRLEKVFEINDSIVFRDFAHAPSKLKATTQAVKEQYPQKKLVACMELHTFSSLNRDFISQYQNAMSAADQAVVFFDPHALQMKKLPDLEPAEVAKAFGRDDIIVIHKKQELEKLLNNVLPENTCFLFMSSGNFGGFDVNEFAQNLFRKKPV
jgi:UDP-N-acetylmuramate: L-alanyl-gamma-D-glutamyl-meso-diaminopimelate ligase